MALTHITAIRNTLADTVVDLIDGGTTDTTGDLVFMTDADVEVATLSWTATPAFGAAVAGVATMNAINDDTSATGGTVALFKFQDRDNAEVFRGTVTATGGGGDIELSAVAVAVGGRVSMTSFTYETTD